MYRLLICCVIGLLFVASAKPQALEMGISGGYGSQNGDSLSVFEGINPDSGTELVESFSLSNGVRIGGRMAFNPRAFFGHEVSYSYQHGGLNFLTSNEQESPAESNVGTVRGAQHVLQCRPSRRAVGIAGPAVRNRWRRLHIILPSRRFDFFGRG